LELVVLEEHKLLVFKIKGLEEEHHHLEKFMQWVEAVDIMARPIIMGINLNNLLAMKPIILKAMYNS
jgi:hypothetical protein